MLPVWQQLEVTRGGGGWLVGQWCAQVRKQFKKKYGGEFVLTAEDGTYANSRVKARLTVQVSRACLLRGACSARTGVA